MRVAFVKVVPLVENWTIYVRQVSHFFRTVGLTVTGYVYFVCSPSYNAGLGEMDTIDAIRGESDVWERVTNSINSPHL